MHGPVDRSRVVAEMRRRAATYPPDSAQAHWHLAQAEIAELYMIWEMEERMEGCWDCEESESGRCWEHGRD